MPQAERARTRIEQLERTCNTVRGENLVVDSKGAKRRAVRDQTGNILRFDASIEDISERRLAELALTAEKRRAEVTLSLQPMPGGALRD
jgi:hypothetical protein